MITLLVMLLIACVVLWAARAIMGAFGIGDPINTVVMVVLTLILLVYLLQYLGIAHLGMIPR
jgi:hypothetical protein